jgi:hypothetical protein
MTRRLQGAMATCRSVMTARDTAQLTLGLQCHMCLQCVDDLCVLTDMRTWTETWSAADTSGVLVNTEVASQSKVASDEITERCFDTIATTLC